jgi:hypothetical protein
MIYTYRIKDSGEKCWYLNGMLHNPVRPAITYPDGRTEWIVRGRWIYSQHLKDKTLFQDLTDN